MDAEAGAKAVDTGDAGQTLDAEPVVLRVGEAEAGQRLDRFLATTLGSRAQAARAIEAGLALVDGEAKAKRYEVRFGDVVSVAAMPAAEAAPGDSDAAEVKIAYEDEHLIVVDKPAGVVVHPARGHWQGTLAQALADRAAGGEDPERAGIVHRLDKDTSGLLVVAKSEAVHRRLKTELSNRTLHREYLALVDGVPPARTGTIDAPIGRDRSDRLLISLETDNPREARTHFELLEVLPSSALLRVSLETGRTHQIRVHMQAIGHPVCGDVTYGGSARFGLERQFLHAARLEFPHPVTGETISVESELPSDLQDALQLARGDG